MTAPHSLEQLLAAKEVVVVCGPGGVGKTTTAASAALMAADRLGGKVLVLTVDPARRLATSLGVRELGNAETRVDLDVDGELWAAMLDTKQSWDDLVRRHAPDAETRDAILANPLYDNIARRFVHSHDYVAMERLHELHASGLYDLIIIDTPPSRRAIDFLEAPERMAEFFSSRLLRWLTVPYRSRFVTAASRPFYTVADRILGSQFLRDIAEFFMLFQTMYDGFTERARAVERTLLDRRTTFCVVSTLEPSAVAEIEYFTTELSRRRLHLGAVVLNRVLPGYLRDPGAARVARDLVAAAGPVAETLPDGIGPPDAVAAVLGEIGQSFLDYRVPAEREQELRIELGVEADLVLTVPSLPFDVSDLEGLRTIGHHLWGEAGTGETSSP